jgi:hypothetical protein
MPGCVRARGALSRRFMREGCVGVLLILGWRGGSVLAATMGLALLAAFLGLAASALVVETAKLGSYFHSQNAKNVLNIQN